MVTFGLQHHISFEGDVGGISGSPQFGIGLAVFTADAANAQAVNDQFTLRTGFEFEMRVSIFTRALDIDGGHMSISCVDVRVRFSVFTVSNQGDVATGSIRAKGHLTDTTGIIIFLINDFNVSNRVL